MSAAVNAVFRVTLLVPLAGVLLLASWAPPAPAATGGVAAEPAPSPTAPAPAPAAAAMPAATTTSLPGPGAVQAALGIPVTHVWDHATRQAIRAFQRKHGLTVDGVVGPKTAAAMGLTGTQATGASHSSDTHVSPELAKIAQCESGDDPAAVSPDGRYRGKYQFTRATWLSVGGHGDPALAPESEQDTLAAKLLARDGTAAWPVCG
jgi:transglycosylase-like protein/putative peptidoglycan binding protein